MSATYLCKTKVAVIGCNSLPSQCRFFRFPQGTTPAEQTRYQKWVEFTQNPMLSGLSKTDLYLCKLHFSKDQYRDPDGYLLIYGAVPTIRAEKEFGVGNCVPTRNEGNTVVQQGSMSLSRTSRLSQAGDQQSRARRNWERLQQQLLAHRDRQSILFRPTLFRPTLTRPTFTSSTTLRSAAPTYQLEPKTRFDPEKVRPNVQEVMEKHLRYVKYSEDEFSLLCVRIGEEMRSRLVSLNFDRYRLVCHVHIVQRLGQGFYSRARFFWDNERDNSVSYYMETPHLLASCLMLGVYKE